jgi:hypothetical protein
MERRFTIAGDRAYVDQIVEAWRRERPDVDVTALGQFARLFRARDGARAAERVARVRRSPALDT